MRLNYLRADTPELKEALKCGIDLGKRDPEIKILGNRAAKSNTLQ